MSQDAFTIAFRHACLYIVSERRLERDLNPRILIGGQTPKPLSHPALFHTKSGA